MDTMNSVVFTCIIIALYISSGYCFYDTDSVPGNFVSINILKQQSYVE